MEVTWQEIDTSEAAASGGPFPQIDASEFIYEIYVYEGKSHGTGAMAACHRCEPQPGGNLLRIDKLKPDTTYCVNIRASLPERDLIGEPSLPANLKTLVIFNDTPPPPKIGNRGPTWLNVSWKNALNMMAMQIKLIIVQCTKDKGGEFVTVWEGTTDQTRIQGLEPATTYSVRIILRNDKGETKPSVPSYAQTASSNPPQQQQQITHVQSQPPPQHHHNGPSSSQIIVQPPRIIGCYNRTIKLIWNPVYGINNYTVKLTDLCKFNSSKLFSRFFSSNIVMLAPTTSIPSMINATPMRAQMWAGF